MANDGRSGAELSRGFFEELVRPLLATRFPDGGFAAARVGTGSDVLGLDDETSRDHDWGLRLSVFVPDDRVVGVSRMLEAGLPDEFHGLPIRFVATGDTRARHHVDVSSVAGFSRSRLGFDPLAVITPTDWLSVTGQAVLEVTAGPVFVDGPGDLTRARGVLGWYPDDLWRYVVACDWARLSQEMPLMGRAADVGDELGSRVISARLAHVVMHLTFMLERRWPPYAKWFGTSWSTLPGADELRGPLHAVIGGPDRTARQQGLADALAVLLARQRRLGLSHARAATVPFWDRPYLHPAPEIAGQVMQGVDDPVIRALRLGRGSIEQRTDNVDVLVDPHLRRELVGRVSAAADGT